MRTLNAVNEFTTLHAAVSTNGSIGPSASTRQKEIRSVVTSLARIGRSAPPDASARSHLTTGTVNSCELADRARAPERWEAQHAPVGHQPTGRIIYNNSRSITW